LGDVPLETFYRAINKVERSLIRTDADEVTYNLHVMLRFDFEMALLEGRLEVKDLPEAWHARFEQDFGIRAPDDRDGVLQDVHWYGGLIGGSFQGYTLGNILSGLFYAAALQARRPARLADREHLPPREQIHRARADRARHRRAHPHRVVYRVFEGQVWRAVRILDFGFRFLTAGGCG
jgi:hypothetical protein